MAGAGKGPKISSAEEFEKAIAREGEKKRKYVLKLYITGMTRRSQLALRNVEKVCHEKFGDDYSLEVIDIYQEPTLARGNQIIAVPTLIKELPTPLRRLIGDLSKEERVLMGLDLVPRPRKTATRKAK